MSGYTIWIDYGSYEGWTPFDYDTIAECLNRLTYANGQGYRITRDVELCEKAEPVRGNGRRPCCGVPILDPHIPGCPTKQVDDWIAGRKLDGDQ